MGRFRSILYLPVVVLLLHSGLIWGQTVHLESGGDTITVICEASGDYRFIGTNSDTAMGTFEIYEFGTVTQISGHITNHDNNSATLDPVGLDGDYEVKYTYYVDPATISVSSYFNVTILDNIEIQGLPGEVCKNDAPYALVPAPFLTDTGATFTFSGPGITWVQDSGFFYDPASPEVEEKEEVQISLSYTSSKACEASQNYTIYNNFVPSLNFSTSSSCIPSAGGPVQFDNLTSGQYAVENWTWDFGDPDSGPDNVSTENSPDHFYSRPGTYNVSLNAETYEGCQVNKISNLVFSDQPRVDFTWISDCFIRGERTLFLDRTESPYAEIDNLLWTFKTSSGGVLGQIPSTVPEDTIEFPFTSIDVYQVSLEVENAVGCIGSASKAINLKPVVTPAASGYLETFDDGTDAWFMDSEDSLESWVLGEPDFTGFTSQTGDLAWYTDLPTSSGYLENSWVESPCFDLAALSAPLVQLDIMKSFVPGTDGAIMQYQHNVSDGWNVLGVVDGGLNWYNSFGIFNSPGGSTYGWSLPTFQPDDAWVRTAYALDMLSDMPYVKFRMAVGTGGEQPMGNQGFAFDNFHLGDRIKTSILEYFTNAASTEALESDVNVQQFVKDYSSTVIDLQYHMDYPGVDSLNLNNPLPPSVRAFNYGVPAVPYAILNGRSEAEYRFDFSDQSEVPDGEALNSASLDISPFDMKLSANFLSNSLNGRVVVSCISEGFDSNIDLYVVVVEKLITAYTGANGTTEFRNVVLDILPSVNGDLLGNEWGVGISKSLDFNWDHASYLEDKEDLMLVAYIIDRDHNQIIQSARLESSTGTASRNRPVPDKELAIYPNPAHAFVYINFGDEVKQAGTVKLVDLSGRSVLSSEIEPGYSVLKLDISRLSPGMYMLQWMESGLLKGQGKLMRAE